MDRPGIELVSADDALAALRERLGLHERVPVIEEFHPVAGAMSNDGAEVILCCHDSANERAHTLTHFWNGEPEPDFDAVFANIRRVLAAPWN